MDLKVGKMTAKELAEWFGISYGTFRNTKKQKLEELAQYADFDEVYGGVYINSILHEGISKYVKGGSRSKEIIFNAFDEEWDESGLDTCSNVADKIYIKHSNELTIAPTTTYAYTLAARNEFYGKPFVSYGSLGSCNYIWVKVVEEKNGERKLVPFTEEENAVKAKLMKQYFSTDAEKEIMVAEMVHSGEISKAEAYDLLANMKNLNQAGFMAFKKELEFAIGSKILKGTQLVKELNFGE